jgi:hypothetical protein
LVDTKVMADVVGNFLPSQDEATMTVMPDRFRQLSTQSFQNIRPQIELEARGMKIVYI